MPERVTGLLGPRRSIATALSRLRNESGKNLEEVARDLMISTSKLSRLENAQGKPQPRDIRDLIDYYGIKGTRTEADLWRWVQRSQETGWWTRYDDKVLENLDVHLSYEADAIVARVYATPFLPALLQTREYSQAIYRDMERRPEDQIDQLLDIREQRKSALEGRAAPLPPLELVAVTYESALRQMVGSPRIMRDQFDSILEPVRPNVHLQVLPFSAKPAQSMTCMYAYFEYEPGDVSQDVVHIETHAGFVSTDDLQDVAKYRRAHEKLVRSSLDEAASYAMIRSIRDCLPNE